MQITSVINNKENIQVKNQNTLSPNNEKSFKDSFQHQGIAGVKDTIFTDFKVGERGFLIGKTPDGRWLELANDFDNDEVHFDSDGKCLGYPPSFIKNYLSNKGAKTEFAIQDDNGYSKMKNSIALVPGETVTLLDGTTLKWTNNGVQFSIPDWIDINQRSYATSFASSLASSMRQFTRVANRETYGIGRPLGITKEETSRIKKVLNAMGINTNEAFYVNGKKFEYDSKSGEFKFDYEDSVDGKIKIKFKNV